MLAEDHSLVHPWLFTSSFQFIFVLIESIRFVCVRNRACTTTSISLPKSTFTPCITALLATCSLVPIILTTWCFSLHVSSVHFLQYCPFKWRHFHSLLLSFLKTSVRSRHRTPQGPHFPNTCIPLVYPLWFSTSNRKFHHMQGEKQDMQRRWEDGPF